MLWNWDKNEILLSGAEFKLLYDLLFLFPLLSEKFGQIQSTLEEKENLIYSNCYSPVLNVISV